ncbi:hypothetical protein XA68_12673 [Ophiocordyceps unilateralis]|uniref:Uncharacterized protein n=1 Tax=Ophiocordyceps unilateralis TaxID=268505 RepID=A0A2A9PCP8_OPHUN|nr:hypothetical protein XA68_12673 [Ophiocordyceps unilateralis]
MAARSIHVLQKCLNLRIAAAHAQQRLCLCSTTYHGVSSSLMYSIHDKKESSTERSFLNLIRVASVDIIPSLQNLTHRSSVSLAVILSSQPRLMTTRMILEDRLESIRPIACWSLMAQTSSGTETRQSMRRGNKARHSETQHLDCHCQVRKTNEDAVTIAKANSSSTLRDSVLNRLGVGYLPSRLSRLMLLSDSDLVRRLCDFDSSKNPADVTTGAEQQGPVKKPTIITSSASKVSLPPPESSSIETVG